jgi:hypothetical protein
MVVLGEGALVEQWGNKNVFHTGTVSSSSSLLSSLE